MKVQVHNRLRLKLAHYLRDRGEIGATPKEIIRATRIGRSTVYELLRELVELGKVVDQGGGSFRSKELVYDLTNLRGGRLGWHGLVIRARNWPMAEKGPLGPPSSDSPPALAQKPLGNFGEWHYRKSKKGGEFWESYGEYIRRRVRFRWWPTTQTLIIYLSTTLNPLSLEEFIKVDGWFRAKCEPVDISIYFELVQGSMNLDYKHVVMEGMKAVRWQLAINGALTAYNKDGLGLRLEAELRDQGAHSIPWEKLFEGLLTLDPRVQEARANMALAAAMEKYAQEVKNLTERLDTTAKKPEKYAPVEELGAGGYQSGYA